MTITPPTIPAADHVAEAPSSAHIGHPVRNFVAVLTLLAAVLGGIWWTGLLAPRLDANDARSTVDSCTHKEAVWFRLTNPTDFTVQVHTVRMFVAGFHVDSITVGGAHARSLGGWNWHPPVGRDLRPFRLHPNESRIVTAVGRAATGNDSGQAPPHVTVTARTALGITRTVSAGKGSTSGSGNTGDCPTG